MRETHHKKEILLFLSSIGFNCIVTFFLAYNTIKKCTEKRQTLKTCQSSKNAILNNNNNIKKKTFFDFCIFIQSIKPSFFEKKKFKKFKCKGITQFPVLFHVFKPVIKLCNACNKMFSPLVPMAKS